MNQDFADLLRAFYGHKTEEDLATPGTIFQSDADRVRIDVLTKIDGVEFEDAWQNRIATSFAGVPTQVLSREHLIRNKRASGRLQDLADIERLEQGDD